MTHDRTRRITLSAAVPRLLVQVPMTRLAGFVTVELIDAATGAVKRHLEFQNLITDAGLDYLAASTVGSALGWLAVGTNGASPANGQTSLGAEVSPRTNNAGGTTDTAGAGPSSVYYFRRLTRMFTELQANGSLTEFGFFSTSTSGVMFARQLFKDIGGTPTTIVKTTADQLSITYELRVYPPTVDGTGTATVAGVGSVDWVTRAANVGGGSSAWSHFLGLTTSDNFGVWAGPGAPTGVVNAIALDTQTLGATTGSPIGGTTSVYASLLATPAYVPGNFFRDIEYDWEPSAGAFTMGSIIHTVFWTSGIGQSSAPYQTRFAVTAGGGMINKTALQRLQLTMRYPWGRGP